MSNKAAKNKTELLDDALEFCLPQLICPWNLSQFSFQAGCALSGQQLILKEEQKRLK